MGPNVTAEGDADHIVVLPARQGGRQRETRFVTRQGQRIPTMSVDPSKVVMFPGTFDAGGGVHSGSSDNAESSMMGRWELVGPVLGWGGTVLAIVHVDGPSGSVAFAGTTAGCFASTDGGSTWEPRNAGLTSPYVQALAVSPDYAKDRTLYAGTLGSGVMRSTNGGLTWRAIDFWQGPVAVTSIAVAIDAANDMVILAGTASGGVFRSSNGGRTFSASNFGLGDFAVLALAMSPTFSVDEVAFAVTNEGLHRSTNGGRAWRSVDRGLDSTAIQAVAFSPAFADDGVVFVATEDMGIFRSTDRGTTWKEISNGLDNLSVNAVWFSPAFVQDRTVFAGTAGSGVYRSIDGGASWHQAGNASDGPSSVSTSAVMAIASDSSGNVVLAGSHQGGLWRSTDRGGSWTDASTGIVARSMSVVAVSPAFVTDRTLFVAGVEDGVVRSEDAGATWAPAATGLGASQVLSLALAPDHSTSGTLHAVLDEGVFRSDDRGTTWTRSDVPGDAPRVASYAANAVGSRIGLAIAFAGSIAISEDGGHTWNAVASPSEDDEIVSVALSPNFLDDRTVVASTFSSTGATRRDRDRAPGARQQFRGDTPQSTITVWRSVDAGVTWQPVIDQITTARWVTTAFPSDYRGDRATVRNGFFVGVGSLVQRPMWGGRQLWIAERPARSSSGVLSLVVSPGGVWNRSVIAGTTDGIHVSDDEGLTWHGVSDGLHTSTIVSVGLAPDFADGGTAFALTLGGALHRFVRDEDAQES